MESLFRGVLNGDLWYISLCIFIVPTGTLRLPWPRVFRAFTSVVRQMPGRNSQRRGTARTLPKIFVFYIFFVLCRSVYFLCVNVYCTTDTGWHPNYSLTNISYHMSYTIYRVSHESRSLLRESVPYVKIYRYNPKHLYPKLNGYGDNGHRKVWASGVST